MKDIIGKRELKVRTYGIDKNIFIELLKKHHIDVRIRAEALELKDFVELYDDFKNICNEEKENGIKEERQ